ncbi:MAG TPA: GNAT family N-acetyltransferase [Solirubrobacteraceae bacterium]|nr:GNAT family N-acetyltransferase [Solirubrobacteraceae bacterium]
MSAKRQIDDVGELTTERLLMRRWRASDYDPFAAINADPRVMELLPSKLTRAESDAYIDSIEGHFEQHGYGLWALELRSSGELIGLTGLNRVAFDAHFTPAVEVGWRLARSAWGHGYASEAGRMALRVGFEQAGLREIVSMTTKLNVRSQAVMERIGMHREEADDFIHPLARREELLAHVLYRLSADEWAIHAGHRESEAPGP